jgi:hypothetical protein
VVLGGSCRRTTACASQQASMTWVVLRQQSKRAFSNAAIVETPAAIKAAYAEARAASGPATRGQTVAPASSSLGARVG